VVGEFGAGADEVVAVVQDEQQSLRAQGAGKDLEQAPTRLLANTEPGRDGLGHSLGVVHRSQFDNANVKPTAN
jgi:hypothetical protein